jgi:hypothetical protein
MGRNSQNSVGMDGASPGRIPPETGVGRCWGTHLEEAILHGAVKQLAVELPHVEAVLHGDHGRDRGAHVAARGVPLHLLAHEVLGGGQRLHFVHVEELELPVERLEPREHHVLALRRPEDLVGRLALERAQLLNATELVLHRVEGNVRPRSVTCASNCSAAAQPHRAKPIRTGKCTASHHALLYETLLVKPATDTGSTLVSLP